MTDIARLVIEADSRQVRTADQSLDNFKGAADKAAVATDRFERQMGQTERRARSASLAFGTMGKSLLALAGGLGIGFAGTAAIGGFFANFVSGTIKAENAQVQLAAALRSTGQVSGQTVDSLNAHAAALQRVTTVGDEVINVAQGILLTFTRIRGDTFPKATEAVLNVAKAMQTDLKSAAIQVGKALNDPVEGMTALSRSGITFSEAQKQMVRDMVATNNIVGAQNLILAELEKQFGGSARAARLTLGGALEALGNTWGDQFELSGKATADLTRQIGLLDKAIADPNFRAGITSMGTGLFGALTGIASAVTFLITQIGRLTSALQPVDDFVGKVFAKIEEMGRKFGQFTGLDKVGPALGLGPGPQIAQNLVPTTSFRGAEGAFIASQRTTGGNGEPSPEDLARAKAIRKVIEALEFEQAQIARTAEQQMLHNQLKAAGVELDSAAGARIEVLTGQIYEQELALRAKQAAEQEGIALTEATRTPLEAMNDALQRNDELLASSAISAQTWARANSMAVAATANAYLGLASQAAGALGKLFGESKAFAIAQAVINTAQAVTQTLAQYGATPFGLAAAAVAAAAGAAQIATIASTSKGGGSSPSAVPSAASASGADTAKQPTQRIVNITLKGGVRDRGLVEELMKEIGETMDDGFTYNVNSA